MVSLLNEFFINECIIPLFNHNYQPKCAFYTVYNHIQHHKNYRKKIRSCLDHETSPTIKIVVKIPYQIIPLCHPILGAAEIRYYPDI